MTVSIGLLERLWCQMFRPILILSYERKRKNEEVAVEYPSNFSQVFESPGSSAITVSNFTSARGGRAKYIRAWVYNRFGFPARDCQVFVERILWNGRVVESERSPLHWTDEDVEFDRPTINWRSERGRYVDICATDSVDGKFQVISKMWTKGYHRYEKTGTYTLKLRADAMQPCLEGLLTITLDYDAENWRNLRVVSAVSRKAFWSL